MMRGGAKVPYARDPESSGYMNCGPTSLCMVISDMIGMEFPPSALLVIEEKYGINVRPYYNGDSIFKKSDLLDLFGMKLENGKGIKGYNKIKQALADDDKYVIANTQHSDFTDDGHYIVLTGYEDEANTKVHVDDPNYYNYTNKDLIDGYKNGFDEDRIDRNTNSYYIFSRAESDKSLSIEELQQIVKEANDRYPATNKYQQKYVAEQIKNEQTKEPEDINTNNENT